MKLERFFGSEENPNQITLTKGEKKCWRVQYTNHLKPLFSRTLFEGKYRYALAFFNEQLTDEANGSIHVVHDVRRWQVVGQEQQNVTVTRDYTPQFGERYSIYYAVLHDGGRRERCIIADGWEEVEDKLSHIFELLKETSSKK